MPLRDTTEVRDQRTEERVRYLCKRDQCARTLIIALRIATRDEIRIGIIKRDMFE